MSARKTFRAPTPPGIRYLQRSQIDTDKWDDCIRQAPNGWIYLRSFYLDALTHWDALVSTDAGGAYAYVMPLPVKKKLGLSYSPVTPMTGQLGIVGREPVPVSMTNDFLRQIPRRFLLVDAILNEFNSPPSISGVDTLARTNLVLPLRAEYRDLYNGYSADGKKNLRRTERAGLVPASDIPPATVVDMYRHAYGKRNRTLTAPMYGRIEALCAACIDRGLGFTLGIRDAENNLQAAGFFGMDDKRIYYLLGAPGPEGRRYSAVHALIDQVIRKYAASGLSLDFEGSDIPSVAAFYRKFGPGERRYHQVRINRLPVWLCRLTGLSKKPAFIPCWPATLPQPPDPPAS